MFYSNCTGWALHNSFKQSAHVNAYNNLYLFFVLLNGRHLLKFSYANYAVRKKDNFIFKTNYLSIEIKFVRSKEMKKRKVLLIEDIILTCNSWTSWVSSNKTMTQWFVFNRFRSLTPKHIIFIYFQAYCLLFLSIQFNSIVS